MIEDFLAIIEDFFNNLGIGIEISLINYLIGISIALLSGFFNNLGIVFEKKALNKLPEGEKVGRHLLKNPLWLLGFIFNMILASILSIVAQFYIGPTLIPGLMASGLIVLALGSLKILNEDLKRSELFGIIIMIIAITSLGFSRLSVEISTYNFRDLFFLIRVIIFTCIMIICSLICNFIQKYKPAQKGLLRAIDSGIMFILINFWMAPMLAVIIKVFSGNFVLNQLILFILASIILPVANYFGVLRLQQAFEYGQASNLRTIQQVPVQIAPMFYYFVIFLLVPPSKLSLPLGIIGVSLIIISGYLLGKRQAALKEIK